MKLNRYSITDNALIFLCIPYDRTLHYQHLCILKMNREVAIKTEKFYSFGMSCHSSSLHLTCKLSSALISLISLCRKLLLNVSDISRKLLLNNKYWFNTGRFALECLNTCLVGLINWRSHSYCDSLAGAVVGKENNDFQEQSSIIQWRHSGF